MQITDVGLLREFRLSKFCEWCKQPNPRGCHPHHYWQRRGMGGGSRLDIRINLIALDPKCHDEAHLGHITKWDFLAVVAAREGWLQDEIIDEIKRLLRG